MLHVPMTTLQVQQQTLPHTIKDITMEHKELTNVAQQMQQEKALTLNQEVSTNLTNVMSKIKSLSSALMAIQMDSMPQKATALLVVTLPVTIIRKK